MINLDLIVIEEEGVDDLDKYRTKRSINLTIENISGIKIALKFLSTSELTNLHLQGDICLFMAVGDLLECKYLEEVRDNYITDSKLILQPGYSYHSNKASRQISKNIDIYTDMASYDVLAIRYFASRHFVSETKYFNLFLSTHNALGNNFIWLYLLYLLNNNHVLMCLGDTISFENLDSELSSRKVKNYGDLSSNPPLSDGFSYLNVLERQNINNVKVQEKVEPKDERVDIKSNSSISSTCPLKESVSNKPTPVSPTPDYIETTPEKVSQHTLDEAIRHDGLVRGVNLTTVRLLNRARTRVKSKKLSVRDKLAITAEDIKSTLNVK